MPSSAQYSVPPPSSESPGAPAAGSPRGAFKHCVVAAAEGQQLSTLHDPHPDGTGVVEIDGAWAGFLVARDPVQIWRQAGLGEPES